jgi:glucan phosphoethanolaminetransferase (alkaline phosphatase superfamily)
MDPFTTFLLNLLIVAALVTFFPQVFAIFLAFFLFIATIVSIGGIFYFIYSGELKIGSTGRSKKLLVIFAITFVWMIVGVLHYACGFKYEPNDQVNCPKSTTKILHLIVSTISCGLAFLLLFADGMGLFPHEKVKCEEYEDGHREERIEHAIRH